jgi:hypothetical protein
VFVHFGFLLVEAWCAFGISVLVEKKKKKKQIGDHACCKPDKRDKLAGDDAVPFLESVVADLHKRKQNSNLVGDVVTGSNVKGFPNFRQRVLTTWPVNRAVN